MNANITMRNGYFYRDVKIINEEFKVNKTLFIKFYLNDNTQKLVNYEEIESMTLYDIDKEGQ